MGGSISSLFTDGRNGEYSEDYLQLTDLGGFLCKYIFIMLDKDKRKLVPKKEYLALVNHFREAQTTEEELDNFLMHHVVEGQPSETINEEQFRKLVIHLATDFEKNLPARMEYLMTLFDKDKDGFVSESDLSQVYESLGIQVPMEPLRSLIVNFDEDRDSKLNAKEFENMGRVAISKLFIKANTVDLLVTEALRRGSASIVHHKHTLEGVHNNGSDLSLAASLLAQKSSLFGGESASAFRINQDSGDYEHLQDDTSKENEHLNSETTALAETQGGS